MGFQFVQIKGHALFQGKMIDKKKGECFENFYRTDWVICSKVGTKHPFRREGNSFISKLEENLFKEIYVKIR